MSPEQVSMYVDNNPKFCTALEWNVSDLRPIDRRHVPKAFPSLTMCAIQKAEDILHFSTLL